MSEGLDPDNIGSMLTDRTVIYARLGCGAYSGQQANDLVEWETRHGDPSRPAIWIQDDAEPGEPDDTPGLDRVTRLIHKGRVTKLVVWRMDRLSKSTSDAARYIERIVNKYGCTFVSVDDHVDTSIPSGKLFIHQLKSLLRYSLESRRLGSPRGGGQIGLKDQGPHKRTIRLAPKAQRLLDEGYTKYETARRLSISRGLLDLMIGEYGLVNYTKGG